MWIMFFFFLVYRRLYRYGGPNCAQCGYPNLVCSCNVRHSLNTSSRQSMILLPTSTESNDGRSEGLAGSNGSNVAASSSSSNSSSHHQSTGMTTTAIGIADTSGEGPSVSFRASTRIEEFTIRETSEPLLRYPCSVSRRVVFPNLEETPRFHSSTELFNLSRDKRLKEPSASAVDKAGTSETPAVAAEESPTSEQPATNELDDFHTRLLSLIECPVCLEPIAPPVHQCRRGHLVRCHCNSCRP